MPSFGAYVCQRRPGGSRAISDLVPIELQRYSEIPGFASEPGLTISLNKVSQVVIICSEEEKTYFKTSDRDGKGMVEKRFALSGASSV